MRRIRARVEVAALSFVRASNPLDEAFVLNFADRPRVDVPFTRDLDRLSQGIARVDSIGGTALLDAVDMGVSYVGQRASRERRVLLVITDGRDNTSTVTLKQLERSAGQSDIAVYAVGLFADPASANAKDGRRELDRLTQQSGGAAFYPSSVDEIDTVVTDLAQQIRNQYTIAYSPTNQRLDGSYRRIRVETPGRPSLVVRTRSGYVAAASTGLRP